MKKIKAMRFASALLVIALLTACAISGTFAKYTTSTTGSDSARVAYWGFDQESTTLNLFSTTYNGSVSSTEDVIAPGTSGSSTFKFAYGGTKTAPEVKYDFTVDAALPDEVTDYGSLDNNPNFYWTLKVKSGEGSATDVNTDKTKYSTVSELIAAIEALAGEAGGSKEYAVGELPAAFNNNQEYTIGWVWDYEAGSDDSAKTTNNATDTKMGNASTLEKIGIKISITATQID